LLLVLIVTTTQVVLFFWCWSAAFADVSVRSKLLGIAGIYVPGSTYLFICVHFIEWSRGRVDMVAEEAVSSVPVSTFKPPQEDGGGKSSAADEAPPPHHRPHRQWLNDRTRGTSQVSENDELHHRPPLPCCWVPVCVGRCPRVFEQNLFCDAMGSIGFQNAFGENRTRRRRIMTLSAIFNAVGFILTLLSCLAMSTKYNILTAFSFTNGHVQSSSVGTTPPEGENNLEFRPITMALGLRAVATENLRSFRYNETGPAVYTFDEFCNLTLQANNRSSSSTNTTTTYFPINDKCHSCRDVSSSLMISLAFSLCVYIPSMSMSFSRMYYNYDVNCRKTLALFTTALSFCLALKTFLGYKNNCYSAFSAVQIPLDMHDRTVIAATQQQQDTAAADDEVVTVALEWSGGVGVWCLVVAMALKMVELVLHLIVPSPSIARNRHEPADYEVKRQEQDKKSAFNDDGDDENGRRQDPSTMAARDGAEKETGEFNKNRQAGCWKSK
jgi:hypothetical protein